MSSTRREFLTTTASLAALSATARFAFPQAAATAPEPALWDIPELKTPDSTKDGDMLFRKLGNTGEKVSLIGLGGYHFANHRDPADSTKLLRRAVDAGINFMDNCWDYRNGDSEKRMGVALKDGYRKKVFLMTKLDGRDKATAARQIDESLQRLQTDMIDLLQIHENIRMSDADKCFAKGGAMEAILDAKKAGKIRYAGFTGHKDPLIHLHMLDVAKENKFEFASAQMPLNLLDVHYHSFAKLVVPRLVKEGVGVLAMKTLAGGAILRTNTVTAPECLRYAMHLPTSTVIAGIEDDERLDQALLAVKNFKPYTQPELAALLAKTKDSALAGRFETFKTTQQYDGTTNNPQWMGIQ